MPIGSQTNVPNAGNSLFLINGSIWHEGAGVPDQALGQYPDFYINTTTNEYYAKQCDGTWLLKGSFGTPISCQTEIINLVANVPLIVSNANITNEICAYQAQNALNESIDIKIVQPTPTTLSVMSNINLNNVQIKMIGF